MTKRVLVPLGERERDEMVLPLVAALARELGATVRLLRVYPSPEMIVGTNGRVVAYVDQEMGRLNGEGLDQLQAADFRLDDVTVEHAVRFGDPVEEIVLEADAWSADLIALSAASRGRLVSAIVPGVTDQVSRRTTIPTLVLRT
jgi:nucleotide-binding universal stress UspA family protein